MTANTRPILTFQREYHFLSNFHESSILFGGESYPSSEHAFAAQKCANVADRVKIRDATTPGGAKLLGRQLPLRADWESVKIDVMRDILRVKFADPVLKAALLATGERHLEEGNTWGDRFWGTVNGVGENWLGKLLMEVRSELRHPGRKTDRFSPIDIR